MTRLESLSPGDEFCLKGTEIYARLIKVNECRAHIYIHDQPNLLENGLHQGYDNWTPTTEVVITTANPNPNTPPVAYSGPFVASGGEGNGTAPQLPKRKRRPRDYGGPTAKDIVYELWKRFPDSTPQELHEEVELDAKVSTIRGWIWHWKRGKYLPVSAQKINHLFENKVVTTHQSGNIEAGNITKVTFNKEREMSEAATAEKVQIEREAGIALVVYVGWLNGPKWGNERLSTKLAQVKEMQDIMPDEKEKPMPDEVKVTYDAVLKAAADGNDIEVTGGTEKEKTPQAKKTPRARGGEMSALDAAETVLKATGKAMKAKELTEEMTNRKLWTSPSSQNPATSVNGAIWTDLKKNGDESRFVKVAPGYYGLKGTTYEVPDPPVRKTKPKKEKAPKEEAKAEAPKDEAKTDPPK